jgi:C4-dicarboxylate transporter DctM subunit
MDFEWYTIGLIMFGGLLFQLMIGIPVGFSLLISAIGTLVILGDGLFFLVDIPGYFFHHLNSVALTCVPLFILMALIAQKADFSRDLFQSMNLWLRRLPGSLNVVGVATCAVFSAISGTSVATAASVGLIALPEFKKHGYDPKLSVGSLAAGGALGILIPPSLPMIMYCIITGQSIGHMFAGGFLPGVLTALVFIVFIVIRCRINPKLAPQPPRKALGEIGSLKSVVNIVPLILIIVAVLASIYLGIATPTEAASIGAVASAVLAYAYKRMKLLDFVKASVEGVRIGAFIILIFLGAIAFGQAAIRGGVAQGLTDFVVGTGAPPNVILMLILAVLFVLGFFMDPTPIILTTMPVLFPLAINLGFDPIYFGVISVMILETAAITPPVGFNLFILRGIGGGFVSMGDIIAGAAPFVLLYILMIVVVLIFPQIIMFLPQNLG